MIIIPNDYLLSNNRIELSISHYANIFHKRKLQSADLYSLVGDMTGYNLIITDRYCGGYFDNTNKIIALNEEVDFSNSYNTIFHELGHFIQSKLDLINKENLISEELKIEWQADYIGYELMSKCFPNQNILRSDFNAYRSKKDLEFLIDWHKGYIENDL